MNKRTLLFVICVSISFFLVEMYFSGQRQDQIREWHKAEKEQQAAQLDALRVSVAERTAIESELPTVAVFADPEGRQSLGRGLLVDGALLVALTGDEAAAEVYAAKTGQPLKRYPLQQKSTESRTAMYGKGALPVAPLHYLGKYDLQLVSTDVVSDPEFPVVTLAEYVDSQFALPLDVPTGDALALVKQDGTYLPVGVYLFEEHAFLPLEDVQDLSAVVAKRAPQVSDAPSVGGETYYVLENEYIQLVFSDRGATVVESNLPFESPEHPGSVVKAVEFDRLMVEQSASNARFPLNAYYTAGSSPQGPHVEHSEGVEGGYYPLLRRAISEGGRQLAVEPQNRAFNIVSQYPELAELHYEVKAFEPGRIVFEAVQRQRRITKTYTLAQNDAAPYVIDLEVRVDGDSRGLWLTSGVPEVELFSGRAAPVVKLRQTRGNKGSVESISLPKDAVTVSSFNPDWICNSNGFFGLIVDPLTTIDAGYMVQHVTGNEALTRLTRVDADIARFKAKDYPGYNALLPLSTQGGAMQFRIYAGPFADTTLNAVDARFTDPATGENPDYIGSQSFHGWFSFISQPFSKFLFVLMKFFYSISGSWAASIVLLTVALRVMLFPLNAWSMKSIRKTQKLSPLVQEIQKKYKKDPRKAQMEVMGLYREHKANPMGGCLPMLIQLPFLVGMFDLLRSTFQLRGAVLVPGWIDDLASPDVLFSWTTPLPLIGNQFHLLPVLLGGIMFVQSKLMAPPPADPNNMTDAERQQRAMSTIMPVMMTVIFYNFASGLSIYWLSSTLLGIVQQWITNRQVDSEPLPVATVVSAPKGGKKGGKKTRARL